MLTFLLTIYNTVRFLFKENKEVCIIRNALNSPKCEPTYDEQLYIEGLKLTQEYLYDEFFATIKEKTDYYLKCDEYKNSTDQVHDLVLKIIFKHHKNIILYCCKKILANYNPKINIPSLDYAVDPLLYEDFMISFLIDFYSDLDISKSRYIELEKINLIDDKTPDQNKTRLHYEFVFYISISVILKTEFMMNSGNYKDTFKLFLRGKGSNEFEQFLNNEYKNFFNLNPYILNYKESIKLLDKMKKDDDALKIFKSIFDNKTIIRVKDPKLIKFMEFCFGYLMYNKSIPFDLFFYNINDYKISFYALNTDTLYYEKIINLFKNINENACLVFDPLIEINIVDALIAKKTKETIDILNENYFQLPNKCHFNNNSEAKPIKIDSEIKKAKSDQLLLIEIFFEENKQTKKINEYKIDYEKIILDEIVNTVDIILSRIENKNIFYIMKKSFTDEEIKKMIQERAKIYNLKCLNMEDQEFYDDFLKSYNLIIDELKNKEKIEILKIEENDYDYENIKNLF